MAPADETDRVPQAQQNPAPIDDELAFETVAPVVRRKRRWLRYVFLFVVLGGAGASAWYAYDAGLFGNKRAGIPIVRANQDPIKVKPASPGGMKVRDQDKLIYEGLKPGAPPPKIERLLPRAETPISPPVGTVTEATPKTSVPVPQKAEQKTERLVPPPSPQKVEKVIPKKMLPKREEKSAVVEKLRAPPPSAPATKPTTDSPAIKTTEQAKLFKKPEPAVEKLLPPAEKSYRIQLAAVRSRDKAEKEWTRIQKKHADLLGDLKLFVMRADLGAKGIYFRLRAGPLSSEAAAKSLCKKLAARKVGCLTVRPDR